jgi:hypothetical protein
MDSVLNFWADSRSEKAMFAALVAGMDKKPMGIGDKIRSRTWL